MKRVILLIYISLLPSILFSQNRNSIWCFGDSAGIDFRNINNPVPFFSVMRGRGSSISIADTNGSLIFYAYTRATIIGNTTQVISANDSLMMNGGNIVGEGWYRELLTIPDPANSKQYYLFCNGVTGSSQVGLFYSKIDMNLNGGLGGVTQKNILLSSNYFSDGIQAIKHGNGRDWWLIARECDITSNDHYFYLISPSGISTPFVQSIGTPSFYNTTRLSFSPDGKKLVEVNFAGLFEIFDFDRCTGVLSNTRIINQENNPWIQFISSEFSPNEDILYASINDNTSYLIQLNLLDTNPWLTHDTLWTIASIQDAGGFLKLAPNGKLYYSCNWYDGTHFPYPYPDSAYYPENMNLGVINSPDNLGAACDFQPYSFHLGGSRCYYGLPNNPNYELPADTTSLCDSLSVGINQIEIANKELKLFYHSGWQTAFINANGLQGKNYSLTIFDITGKQLFSEKGRLFSEYFTKDLHFNFANGIYIVSLATEKEILSNKFIVR
jgi:hypothetical protein